MYDYAHCVSDSLEGITHSLCTLEFEDHRPMYDWFLDKLGIYHSQQIEFARLALTYTMMSKRKLLRLVKEGVVSGWNDPRMPTLSGMRRRGYTSQAILAFCDKIGVAKTNSVVEFELLEHTLRQDLEQRARRAMAVLDPLKLVINNYPSGMVEDLEILNFPQNPEDGSIRKVPFSGELFIEADDFMENPPKKYFRLSPGAEVRLFNAYLVKCTGIEKDDQGNVCVVHCEYDPATRGGNVPEGKKVKGTIHWVSAAHAIDAEVRLYEHLFTKPDPNDAPEGKDFTANLNLGSLQVLKQCKLEPDLANATPETPHQFMRKGYFCLDKFDSSDGRLVFNHTISLRDTWAKIQQKMES
jgi:glutaminyl-tRNA synthetase